MRTENSYILTAQLVQNQAAQKRMNQIILKSKFQFLIWTNHLEEEQDQWFDSSLGFRFKNANVQEVW